MEEMNLKTMSQKLLESMTEEKKNEIINLKVTRRQSLLLIQGLEASLFERLIDPTEVCELLVQFVEAS